jgi:hypothetical protein
MGDSRETSFDCIFGEHLEGDLVLDDQIICCILNRIDCFVSQSLGNKSVDSVFLYPHAFHGENDDFLDKVGKAIGNLQALDTLSISPHNAYPEDDEQELPNSDWEILACILSHVRQKVEIILRDSEMWDVEAVQALARKIRGHPAITSFGQDTIMFPCYASLDSLYSVLATLPALKSVNLGHRRQQPQPDEGSTLAHHESLTELLLSPSLRTVSFGPSFTPALCQATANALMGDTAVTNLHFSKCSFSAGESAAILGNGFGRNTSVSHIKVVMPFDETLNGALAAALPSNSTLQVLAFDALPWEDPVAHVDWSPIFSGLGRNTGLKSLKVAVYHWMDESLCTAMQNGLEANETLESLELNHVHVDDDNAAMWRRSLSFLRTNKALKSLMVTLQKDVTESCISTFRLDIATMLQENTSLENLFVQSLKGIEIRAEEYFELVTALQHNTTLESLNLNCQLQSWLNENEKEQTATRLNDDEDNHMASLLTKNYALESIPGIDLENEARNVGAILRLNKAGRRYLVQDGSSISKGVDVLSKVNNDINCVFLHLLENPRLCDSSAVEMVTTSESNSGRSTNLTASSGGGKREQASEPQGGKESRRRLA